MTPLPATLAPRLQQALSGVFGILVTPFDGQDRIEPDLLRPIIDRAVGAGIGALTVNGNTSEFFALTLVEARRMQAEVPSLVAGRAIVVAGVGRSVGEACALAKSARGDGCDLVMVHQPADPFRSPRGVADYVERIAEAADGLPVVLYLRDDTGGAEAIGAMTRVPGVVAVKWATPNLMVLAAARRAAPDLAWICGLAEPWAPAMQALGTRGFTSGVINVVPRLAMAVWRALEDGDPVAARRAIEAVEPFERLRATEGNGANIPVVKAALAIQGMAVGHARPPASWPLPEPVLERLRAVLAGWEDGWRSGAAPEFRCADARADRSIPCGVRDAGSVRIRQEPTSMTPSRITCLRTLRLPERANLCWVELETAEGLVGLGEAFRGAAAVEGQLHELVAPYLLGRDSREIEAIHRHLTTPYVGFGASSAELRAASAVDIALWDLAGQRFGVPVHEALGGLSRTRIRAYNTCAGYDYNSRAIRRETDGAEAVAGPYDDQVAFMRDAGELAHSLLEEGFGAMKIWPFDGHAAASGGQMITLEQLKQGMEPFEKIRAAVGDRIEVMAELHSMWSMPAAARICQALAPVRPFWAEDPIGKMDDWSSLAELRRQVPSVPICASETLGGKVAFRDMLVAGGTDIVMVDLTWCGGLTEARKIAALAEAWARPLAPHDCTGPVTLVASLHFALHAATAIFQEVVRATLATWYRDLVTELPVLERGWCLPMQGPGLGTKLSEGMRRRAVVRESRG